ncbi:hypothetical protein [Halorhabdus salina]|nr:hypothetical protein [Halorhabdus salina]
MQSFPERDFPNQDRPAHDAEGDPSDTAEEFLTDDPTVVFH